MAGSLIASVVTPHTPRMGVEETAPEFVRGLIDAGRELGAKLRALEPDVIVLQSAHWVSTFLWYVTAHEVHEGICIADEAPDLIPGVPYRRPGDPEFARAIQTQLEANGLKCGLVDSPHFRWDYGTYVPLKYIDPESTIPVVTLPTVICSDQAENRKVGGLMHEAAVQSGRRAVFIASCALAHKVRRGPELWPSEDDQANDRRFVDLLTSGKVPEVLEWSPEYLKLVGAEMDGRPLSGMLGAVEALHAAAGSVRGEQIGPYCQSSGSGNATVCVTAAAAS